MEGWSTSDQHWSGVRLRDLAELAGFDPRDGMRGVFVASLQRSGAFRHAALRDNQVRARSAVPAGAAGVGGEDLSLDHGYPARVIVPAAPGGCTTPSGSGGWRSERTDERGARRRPPRAARRTAGRAPARRPPGSRERTGSPEPLGSRDPPGCAGCWAAPFQIVLLLASFVLAGYAGARFLADDWLGVAIWFVGAALLHDLVLVPLYSLADRVPRLAGRYVNHLRIPALLSLLLLLVWFPLITGPAGRYAGLTGRPAGNNGYALHWLWLTVGLFAASGLWLAVRTLRGRRNRQPAPQGRRSATNERPPDSH